MLEYCLFELFGGGDMMSVLKIILILIVLIPIAVIMLRIAADIRKDIIRHKKRERAASPPTRNQFRVIR